jgi:beta-glucosidase
MSIKIRLIPFIFFFIIDIAYSQNKFPYQDESLPIEQRVEDLISRMTLDEKLHQLFNEAPAIQRLGIPAYNWWNECLHGVARAGKATVFPQAIGMAASFDEDMMSRISTAIADEARAKHHYFVRNNARGIYMGLTFWTPNINIFRDPRWGRGQETYGEDPFLTSRMAVNFIKGLQGDNPKYLKTIATAKHYAVHSGPEFTRHGDNIFVNDHDLYETYLPAFKAAVTEANVQSIMCAYNRFRDKPCCGSDLLLNNILRNEFGFKGYVVSDCGAISDFYKKGYHEIVDKASQAWGWSLAAGTDLNCEGNREFLEDNIDDAVARGVVNEKDINTALTRLFTARFKLGLFDREENNPYAKIPMEVVGSSRHQKLSLEAAEKAIVLLKNTGLLPLNRNQKIALIGPNANNISVLVGNYNGDPIHPSTPLGALTERIGTNLNYVAGTPIIDNVFTDEEIIDAQNLFHLEKGILKEGLVGQYFTDTQMKKIKFNRIDKLINFYWDKSPINGLVDESFSVRWSGLLVPRSSGSYFLNGNLSIKINGEDAKGKTLKLEKGKRYDLQLELVIAPQPWASNLQQQHAELRWVRTDVDYRANAINAAKKSDVVIFCGGISPDLEGEEMPVELDGFAHGDRTHINLPKVQEDLLKEIYNVNKNIVYVNFSGSAVAMNWEKENVPAILQAFYPGEATGVALTNILFGNSNPSGKLPVTFYKSITDLPDFGDYGMKGRTYRYFNGDVLYPFGYGLSYTKFSYSELKIPKEIVAGSELKFSVTVTNIGALDGSDIAQVYLTNKAASTSSPIRSLAAFQRVSLKKGESKQVDFKIDAEKFSTLTSDNKRIFQSGDFILSVGSGQVIQSADGVQIEIVLSADKK